MKIKKAVVIGTLIIATVSAVLWALSAHEDKTRHNDHLADLQKNIPAPFSVDEEIRDFKGRVVSSFEPPNILFVVPFEEVRGWGPDAILTYTWTLRGEYGGQKVVENLEIRACKPDPITTGAFLYASKNVRIPWEEGHEYVTGNWKIEDKVLMVSAEINPDAFKQGGSPMTHIYLMASVCSFVLFLCVGIDLLAPLHNN